MNSIILLHLNQKLFKTPHYLCPCLQLYLNNKKYLSSAVSNTSSRSLEHANFLKSTRVISSNAYSVEAVLKKFGKRVYGAYSDVSKCKIGAALTYERCADGIDYQFFFKYLKLPDTFFSWFLVIQLHVWMICLVTISEKNGRVFRNQVISEMWNDVEQRLEHLAVLKSSTKKKYLQDLVEQFQSSLIAYDEGALDDDKVLAAAIWRTLFSFNKEIDPRLLEALVFYVRKQIHHLESINVEELTFFGKLTLLPFEETMQEIGLLQNK